MKKRNLFDLKGQLAVITGGAGLLGIEHGKAIHMAGGIPVIADLDVIAARRAARKIGRRAFAIQMDVTNPKSVDKARREIIARFKRCDILINNAAFNPKMETGVGLRGMEDFQLEQWNLELAVGLTGAVICSRAFGGYMAKHGGGVILNIASDLALIGPDQRIYKKPHISRHRQLKKPVSYSVVKSGLLGLTRYLATYWAQNGVRANALCPGGVENGQSRDFVRRLSALIPMGRMARVNEYQGAIMFLCSDASSYMTGSIVSMDGGRTAW